MITHDGIVMVVTDRGNIFVDGVNGRTLMELGPGTGIKAYRSSSNNGVMYITASNSSRYTAWSGSGLEVENQTAYKGAYSNASTYAVDDIVTQDSKLYKCSTAISTAEEWTAAHWTLIAQ